MLLAPDEAVTDHRSLGFNFGWYPVIVNCVKYMVDVNVPAVDTLLRQ